LRDSHHPKAPYLAAGGGTIHGDVARGAVKLWNIETRRPISELSLGGNVSAVAFSPDGQRLITGDDHGNVQVWKPLGLDRPMVSVAHLGLVTTVAFSPDRHTFASGSHDKTVRIWDVHHQKALLEHDYSIRTVAFSAVVGY
jgi:WD40 repeat protein